MYKKNKGINRMLLHAKEVNFSSLEISCTAEEPSIFKRLFND